MWVIGHLEFCRLSQGGLLDWPFFLSFFLLSVLEDGCSLCSRFRRVRCDGRDRVKVCRGRDVRASRSLKDATTFFFRDAFA